MTRVARIIDIAVRSFFMFLVGWLVFSYMFRGFFVVLIFSILVTATINAIYELTVGRKYWRAIPKNTRPKRKFKVVARDIFTRAFSRDKTKGFVWAGVVILMMSFVVRMNVYYIVAACVVFVFAAATRFAPARKCATINGDGQNDGEKQTADGDTGGGVCGENTQP